MDEGREREEDGGMMHGRLHCQGPQEPGARDRTVHQHGSKSPKVQQGTTTLSSGEGNS